MTIHYNPHAPDWHGVDQMPADITLEDYAKAWIDMEPHVLHLIGLARQCKSIVEFGVRGAVSSWALLTGLPPDGRLVSVDIIPDRRWYDVHQPGWTGYVLPLPPQVRDDPRFTLITGSSLDVDLPERCDMVMIDSGHDYELTVGELQRAMTMKPRWIVLHDYLYSETRGVAKAVDEAVDAGWADIRGIFRSKWGLIVLTPR